MADKVQPADKLLVNRGGQSYKVNSENLMAEIQDTDLMLVQRSGQSYKVLGSDVKDSLNPSTPPEVTDVSLAEGAAISGKRFDGQSFISTVTATPGEPAAETTSIKATLEARMEDKLETSAITNVGTDTGVWNIIDSSKGLPSATWNGVAYGSGTYVAVSNGGGLYTAIEGDGNWTQSGSFSGMTSILQAVAYGNGRWVAVIQPGAASSNNPTYNAIWSDAPKTSWNNATSLSGSISPRCVAYGGGLWMMGGANNGTNTVLSYSTDGISWQTYALSHLASGQDIKSLFYANGRWFATGTDNSVLYSDDPTVSTSWIQVTTNLQFPYMVGGNPDGSIIIIVGSNFNDPGIKYSVDNGLTWKSGTNINYSFTPAVIGFNGAYYVALGTDANVDANNNLVRNYTSLDGKSWEPGTADYEAYYKAVAWGTSDREWVAVGGVKDSGPYAVYSKNGGASQTQLTFTDTTDLNLFPEGGAVVQSNDAAAGTVGAITLSNKTMNLASSTGTWATGQTVIGPAKPLSTSVITAVDGSTLTFTDDTNLALFEDGDPVFQDNGAAAGLVGSTDVSAKTMQISGSAGTWSANTGNYVIGPNKANITTSQLFAQLDSSLNVVDLTETDPGFTDYSETTTPTITFPATLPNGETPDEALLEGTSIFTTVRADNLVPPASEKNSNTVTPAVTCDPGPIETSAITNVTSDPVSYSDNAEAWGNTPQSDGSQQPTGFQSPASKAFNGSTADNEWASSAAQNTTAYMRFSFDAAIADVGDTFEVWISEANPSNGKMQIKGYSGTNNSYNDGLSLTKITGDKWGQWVEIPVAGPVYGIQVSLDSAPYPSTRSMLAGIRVNGTILVNQLNQVELTLTDDTGLDELNSGDPVVMENEQASGNINTINVSAKTMTVNNVTGTWVTGQKVIGPNRVCPQLTFNSNVSSELANFNTLKTKLQGYEAARNTVKTAIRNHLLSAGYTANHITTLGF